MYDSKEALNNERGHVRRVAITGMGVISSLGHELAEVADALRQGRSGVELIPGRKELGFRSALAGKISDFAGPDVSKTAGRYLNSGSRMGVAAAMKAVEDTGLSEDQLANERTGVIVGNTGNMADIFQLVHQKYVTKKKLTAGALVRTMPSTVSAHLSIMYHTRGQSMTVSAACASGSTAISQATQLVQIGAQDRVIAGGVQETTWEFDSLFDALRVFSKREDRPAEASRPFDRNRDGLVPSGGSGFVFLEEYELAKSRGAKIYGEIIGHASNSDGEDMTTPSGIGSVLCMRKALTNAGLRADQIDYINAHATSTTKGDAVEAQSIKEVFEDRPYVSSTKSMTGHEVGAAGATEVIYTLLMMEHGFVAPSINIQEVGPDCHGIRIVANQAIEADLNVAMSNSFGFGGVNTVLVVKKPD